MYYDDRLASEIRNRPRQPTEREKAHAEARAFLKEAKSALAENGFEKATALATVALAITAAEGR